LRNHTTDDDGPIAIALLTWEVSPEPQKPSFSSNNKLVETKEKKRIKIKERKEGMQ
jgi:hypothetical protein